MTIKELIEKLKEYPEDMKVCIENYIFEDIDLTVLEAGLPISDSVDLEEPWLSIC